MGVVVAGREMRVASREMWVASREMRVALAKCRGILEFSGVHLWCIHSLPL